MLLEAWAVAENVRFGAEFVGEPRLSAEALARALPGAGRTLQEALAIASLEDPVYVWWQDRDIIRIQPRIERDEHRSFLYRGVEHFRLAQANVRQVLREFHRLYDSKFPEIGPISIPQEAEVTAPDIGRMIDVDLRNVSGRDVLDAVVRRHGAISWRLAYRDSSLSYSRSNVCLVGRGWRVEMNALAMR